MRIVPAIKVRAFRRKTYAILKENGFYDTLPANLDLGSSYMIFHGPFPVATMTVERSVGFEGQPVMYVSYLCVRKSYQNRGLGTSLLFQLLLDWALHLDIQLDCWSPELVTYYQKLKFQIVHTDRDRYCLQRQRTS